MNSGNKLKNTLWLLPALLLAPVLFASAALTGQQIYDQKCAGCHSLGAYDSSGSPNLAGRGSKVVGKFTGAHLGITLAAADITTVAAFLNNPAPAPPTVPTPTAMSASDKNLFIKNCLNCHTPTGLQNRTAAQISAAIRSNVGGMGTRTLRALSSTNITAITRALVPQTPPTTSCNACHSSSPETTPTPTTGQSLYDTKCAGCHSLKPYDTSGSPDLSGTGAAVADKFSGRHFGIALTNSDITNITSFINNPATPAPTPTPTPALLGQAIYDNYCAGCHRLGTYDSSGSADNLSGEGSEVNSKYTAGSSGHKSITLSASDISSLKTFLNAN
jgi:mono/diheme cytochrome c family protein